MLIAFLSSSVLLCKGIASILELLDDTINHNFTLWKANMATSKRFSSVIFHHISENIIVNLSFLEVHSLNDWTNDPWSYSNQMATSDDHPYWLLHELKCFWSIIQVTSNLWNLPSVAHYNPLMACIYKIPLSLLQIKKQLRPNQIHEWLPPTISKSAELKFNFQQSYSPTARRHSKLMRIWT